MYAPIVRVLRSSDTALTTREICCAINGRPRDYCLNVDGNGARCVWWFRRPRHEKQRIRLVKPVCRVRSLDLYPYLKVLVERGIVKRWEGYLPDPLSVWGYDRHVLYYVNEEQLRKRLEKELGILPLEIK